MKNNEKEKTIFNDLIELMQTESSNWISPLVEQCKNGGLPTSLVSNKVYEGSNFIRLLIASYKKGFTSNQWGTFKYFNKLNARINKGEKATPVVHFQVNQYDKKENGKVKLDSQGNAIKVFVPQAKWFNVFNVEQTNMQTEDKPEIENVEFSIDSVDQFVASQNANIKHIEYCIPCYKPSHDMIEMPMKGSFTDTPSSSQFYVVPWELLHKCEKITLSI